MPQGTQDSLSRHDAAPSAEQARRNEAPVSPEQIRQAEASIAERPLTKEEDEKFQELGDKRGTITYKLREADVRNVIGNLMSKLDVFRNSSEMRKFAGGDERVLHRLLPDNIVGIEGKLNDVLKMATTHHKLLGRAREQDPFGSTVAVDKAVQGSVEELRQILSDPKTVEAIRLAREAITVDREIDNAEAGAALRAEALIKKQVPGLKSDQYYALADRDPQASRLKELRRRGRFLDDVQGFEEALGKR